MNFSMHDFNGDGTLDILYVNGDNYDNSRILSRTMGQNSGEWRPEQFPGALLFPGLRRGAG